MAYQPSLSDVQDLMPNASNSQASSSSYTPSLNDVKDLLPQTKKQNIGLLGAASMLADKVFPGGNLLDVANDAPSFAQGLAEAGQSIPNTIYRGINSVAGTNLKAPSPDFIQGKQSPLNPQGLNTTAQTAGQVLGNAVPFVASDGLTAGMKYLPKIAAGAASGVAQGAMGAANNPNANMIYNMLFGGGLGAAGNAIGGALPSYLARQGNLASKAGSDLNTPSQAASILAVAKANKMNPDIGTLTNSSGSSSIYNDVLGSVPFSGVPGEQKNIIGKTEDLANNIMNGFKGDSRAVDDKGNPIAISPGDIGDHLKESVSQNMATATKNNKQKFAAVFDQAAKQGLTMSPTEFPNTAAVAKKLLSNGEGILGITPDLPEKFQTNLQSLIDKNPTTPDVANNHIVDLGGSLPESDIDQALNSSDVNSNPDKNTIVGASQEPGKSITSIHKEISDIGDLARKSSQTGDMKTASFYTSIKNAMNQDLNNKMSQIPGLSDAFTAAKKDFADNVVPYRQQQILSIINNKSDANSLPQLLTKTNNQKIYQDLSEDDQNKVIYSKLKNSAQMQNDSNIGYSPTGIINSYKDMQKNLPSYVINSGAKQKLEDLSKLNDIYKTANANVNAPYTGFRAWKKWGPLAGLAALGGGSHFLGADIPESLAAMAGLPIVARAAGKVARSSALQNMYINPNQSNNIIPAIARNPLYSLLLNQGGSKNGNP